MFPFSSFLPFCENSGRSCSSHSPVQMFDLDERQAAEENRDDERAKHRTQRDLMC